MKTPSSPLMRCLVLGWSIALLPDMKRLRWTQANPQGRMASRRPDTSTLDFLWAKSQKIPLEFFFTSKLLRSSTCHLQKNIAKVVLPEVASRHFSLCGSVLPKRSFITSDTHVRDIQHPELDKVMSLPSGTQKAVWIRRSLWAQEIKYT